MIDRYGVPAALSYPFTLGVASGDPSPDGVVLWTRLALAPLAADGLGGMPDRPVEVGWEVAADERFRTVVRRGEAVAAPAAAHSVHVEVAGLASGREYFYRFRAAGHLSPAGRTRTAPPPGQLAGALTMAVTSCAHYEDGYFTAYRRLAQQAPDLVVHLGDYLYEYPGRTTTPRRHEGPEAVTLAQYRQRHAQYKTDADLQAAHAAAPWLVVWDDHDVDDNWAGAVPTTPQPDFAARRAAAFRAYYEHLPLRRRSAARGADLRLYRRVRWGRLATFHLLDTRQYRDDQACGDGFRVCPDAADPARSILGAQQERWLLDAFRRSDARWDVLAQQVFFARRDAAPGPQALTSQDAWDGYPACRDRITRGWVAAGVRNPVVLTGDVHAHWAGDLLRDDTDPGSRPVGSELVCSSVTTKGDGADGAPTAHPYLRINPHLRFHNDQRGYLLATVTPAALTAEYMVVPYVSRPGAPAYVRATFTVEDRVAGPRQTYDRPVDPTPSAGGAGAAGRHGP